MATIDDTLDLLLEHGRLFEAYDLAEREGLKFRAQTIASHISLMHERSSDSSYNLYNTGSLVAAIDYASKANDTSRVIYLNLKASRHCESQNDFLNAGNFASAAGDERKAKVFYEKHIKGEITRGNTNGALSFANEHGFSGYVSKLENLHPKPVQSNNSSPTSGTIIPGLIVAGLFGIIVATGVFDSTKTKIKKTTAEANTHFQQSQYYEAAQDYSKVLTLDPNNSSARNMRQSSLDNLENQGLVLQKKGNLEAAITAYDKVLSLDPEDRSSRQHKGESYLADGKNKQALESFLELLRYYPDDTVALTGEGMALHRMDRNQEAVNVFNRIINIDPNAYYAWNNKADVLFDNQYYENAISCYKEALRINSEFMPTRTWQRIGQANVELRRYSKAISAYTNALKTAPNNSEILKDRGDLKFELADYANAIEDYKSVLAIHKGNVSTKVMLGRSYWKLGEHKKALQTWF